VVTRYHEKLPNNLILILEYKILILFNKY